MKLTREEVLRKVLHIFSGSLIPAAMLSIPWHVQHAGWNRGGVPPWMYVSGLLGVIFVMFFTIELARFRFKWVQDLFHANFGSMLRHEESKMFTGATWIWLSAFLCSIIFHSRPDISAMALSTFIWGDAIAALVGISIGRVRIGKKSLEGSAACFALCLAMYYGLFPFVPLLYKPWGGLIAFPVALIASLSVTILELFPLYITKKILVNDNLVVPVVTGFVLLLLDMVF